MKKIAIAFTALAMVIGPVGAMAQQSAGAQSGSTSSSGSVAGSRSSSQGGAGGEGGSAFGQGGVAGASSGSSLTVNNYPADSAGTEGGSVSSTTSNGRGVGRVTAGGGTTGSVNVNLGAQRNENYNNASGGYSNTNRNIAEGGYHSSQQVRYSGSYSVKNVPGVVAPALTTTLTETCMGSTSIGGAGVGFGVSFGTTWRDTACVRRLDARQLLALGHSDAATELMCDSEAVKGAFRRVGRPCAEDGPRVVARPVTTQSAEYGMTRVASAPVSGGVDAYRRAMSQCGDINYSACMKAAKKHLN